MSKILCSYIRVSTDKQTLENQTILEFAFNKKIQIEDLLKLKYLVRKLKKKD